MADIKYFAWGNGVPAYWEDGDFPTLVTANGERIIYDLPRFAHGATPISKAHFDLLVVKTKTSAEAPN
jgi:hypothetical protein